MTNPDVSPPEAKSDSKNDAKNEAKKEAVSEPSFPQLLKDCLAMLNSGIVSSEPRIIGRMLRRVSTLRQLFDAPAFMEFVQSLLSSSCPAKAALIAAALSEMQPLKKGFPADVEMSDQESQVDTKSSSPDLKAKDVPTTGAPAVPIVAVPIPTGPYIKNPKDFEKSMADVELFLTTLAMMALIDSRQTDKADCLAEATVAQLSLFPQPHKLDELLVGKAIFYSARVYELQGKLSTLKGFLMQVYRTSVLHHNLNAEAIALNLILRNFLQQNQYDQAVKFLEKAPYPSGLRSNAQHARYLYYLACINAIRLDYGEARAKVTQAIQKAPQEGSSSGKGFRVAAHKLCIVIQLLMGEIPERRIFNQKDLKIPLTQYAKIVQSVRSGDLVAFQSVFETHVSVFAKDGTLDLVQRLRQNVIRVGLRKIIASYSQISLKDVAAKLGLGSSDDIECIIAKAIADGIIDAQINVESWTMHSNPHSATELSDEPRKALHGRIAFCLQLYNDAVEAMQYPETETDIKIEEAEARRKEHQEQLARAEKDEFDGGDDGDLI